MRKKIRSRVSSKNYWSAGAVPLIPLIIISVITVVSAITAIINTTNLAKRQTTSTEALIGSTPPVSGPTATKAPIPTATGPIYGSSPPASGPTATKAPTASATATTTPGGPTATPTPTPQGLLPTLPAPTATATPTPGGPTATFTPTQPPSGSATPTPTPTPIGSVSPCPPSISSPAAGSILNTGSIVRWNPCGGAVGYSLYFTYSGGGSSVSSVTGTSYTFTSRYIPSGLVEGKEFSLHLKGCYNSSCSSSSTAGSKRTYWWKSSGSVSPPTATPTNPPIGSSPPVPTATVTTPPSSPTATFTPTPPGGATATPTPTPTPPGGATNTPPPGATNTPTPTSIPGTPTDIPPTGGLTPTDTPIPTAGPNAAGLLFMIQIPDVSAANISANEVLIEARDSSGTVRLAQVDLVQNGNYFQSSSEVLLDIPQDNTYDIFIKTSTSLGRLFAGVNLAQNQTLDCSVNSDPNCGELISQRDNKLFLSGDSDGFDTGSGSYNRIDSADLQVLNTYFNQPASGPSVAADYNLDGMVDISDLEILGKNYSSTGD